MSYDPKCLDLADVFIPSDVDYKAVDAGSRKVLVEELAQEIQDSIELWFEGYGMEIA